MAVTQLVRGTQLKPGTAYRLVVNDSTGKMAENAALTASRVLVSDANGQPSASSTTDTVLGYLDVSSSLTTLLGGKLSLTGGTMSGAIAMGTNKITGLGDPSANQDAATKFYVDSVAQGLNIHAPCHVATTVELAVAAAGTQTTHTLTYTSAIAVSIDGHPLSLNDRVLVKNQTTVDGAPRYGNKDNGIYTVTTVGVTVTAATPSGTITYGSPSPTDTVVFTGLPTDGTKTFTCVASGPGADEFSSISELTALINGLTDLNATDNGTVITMTVVTAGSGMNSATVTGTGSYSGLSITFSGGLNAVACVLTRAADFNGVPSGEVATGDFTFVEVGSANGGTGWVVTSGAGAIVVDTDPIVWSQFSGGGTFTAGNGIDVTGTVISLAPLLDGKIIVGNVSNVATNVAMSGEATIINTGAVTLSNSAVIGKVLTGFSSGAGAVTSSDSILAAIQHLDGNDGLKLSLTGGTLTGALTINPVSNQLVLGGVSAGTTVTISSTAPLANRVLTIPAPTGNRNFLLSGEAQIVAADISASAAIALSQLASIGAGKIIVGAVTTGNPTAVDMSADATISNTGALTIASSAVTFSKTYQVVREVPTGDINSSNRVYTTANNFVNGSEMVFLNGILQNAGGNDYTRTAANEITFEVGNAPQTNSILLISYWRA